MNMNNTTTPETEHDFCKDGCYFGYSSQRWIKSEFIVGSRSLTDIRRIVELEANQVRAETLINELHMQIFPSNYMDNRVCLYKAITEKV